MNTVAPPFVSGDNILSSSCVKWTVSWIRLTPRISISVNTGDNLDNCHQATRTSIKRKKKKKKTVHALCSGFAETLWQLWTCQESQGAYVETLKCISRVSLLFLATLKEISACLDLASGLDFSVVLTMMGPNENANEIWFMHLVLFDLIGIYRILSCVQVSGSIQCRVVKVRRLIHAPTVDKHHSMSHRVHQQRVRAKLRERERREGGRGEQKRDGNLCPSSPVFKSHPSEGSHSRGKDNLQLRDALLAWPKPLKNNHSLLNTLQQVTQITDR